jgi:hypothetical protein
LIKVIGNGLVRIEPYDFIVTGNEGELWIDSEIFETYALVPELVYLTDELNENITDDRGKIIEVAYKRVPVSMGTKVEFTNYVYPEIIPGKTFVTMAPTIEELTIIPRWWRL